MTSKILSINPCFGLPLKFCANVVLTIDLVVNICLATFGIFSSLPFGYLAFYLLAYTEKFDENDGVAINLYYLSVGLRYGLAVICGIATMSTISKLSASFVNLSYKPWRKNSKTKQYEISNGYKQLQLTFLIFYIICIGLVGFFQYGYYGLTHKVDWDWKVAVAEPETLIINDPSCNNQELSAICVRCILQFFQMLILLNVYKQWIIVAYVHKLNADGEESPKSSESESLERQIFSLNRQADDFKPKIIAIYQTFINTFALLLSFGQVVNLWLLLIPSYEAIKSSPYANFSFVFGAFVDPWGYIPINNSGGFFRSAVIISFYFGCNVFFLYASLKLWQGITNRDMKKCRLWIFSQLFFVMGLAFTALNKTSTFTWDGVPEIMLNIFMMGLNLFMTRVVFLFVKNMQKSEEEHLTETEATFEKNCAKPEVGA